MVRNTRACLLMDCVKAREKLEQKAAIITKEAGKMGLRMALERKSIKMERRDLASLRMMSMLEIKIHLIIKVMKI